MNQHEIEEDTQVIPLASRIDLMFNGLSRQVGFRILNLVIIKMVIDIVKEDGFDAQAKEELTLFFKNHYNNLLNIMEKK